MKSYEKLTNLLRDHIVHHLSKLLEHSIGSPCHFEGKLPATFGTCKKCKCFSSSFNDFETKQYSRISLKKLSENILKDGNKLRLISVPTPTPINSVVYIDQHLGARHMFF